MNTQSLRKLSIYTMIGSLIGAATIAVIAVLAGSFNDTFGKAIGTLVLVMIHALVSLAFIDRTTKNSNAFQFFENAVFFIIVLSFFTSIFGVWNLFSGDLVAKLYGTYGVLLFASLHGQMLSETRGKQANIDMIVSANYGLMGLVIIMILPLIWFDTTNMAAFYYRLLAAVGIVDATLTVLAVILHRMYIQKHPEAASTIYNAPTLYDANGKPVKVDSTEHRRRIHPLVWLLAIYLIGQVVVSVLFAVLGAFYRR